MKSLIYAIILLAGLVAIPVSSQANSIVCQYINSMYPIYFVYNETPDSEIKDNGDVITDVNYHKVYYADGRIINMNTSIIQCHVIIGNKDEAEARLVEDFVNKLEGDSSEGRLQ